MFSSKKKNQGHESTAIQEEQSTDADAAAVTNGQAAAAVAADEPAVEPATAQESAPPPDPLVAELAAVKDRYARLMADFDNFRKRQVREREEVVKRANEALILELLHAIDHLDLALTAAANSTDPFVTGVRMVADQIHAALAKFDARPEDAVGQPFDPGRHEALNETPSDVVPAGHVSIQLRKGWSLAGRLLRPAQVMISSGPANPTPDSADAPAAV
ncbi:MAG: nucleotide exchange factor GrpE [Lentisphaerae bacterium]|nr:nucleotide exchange factor GrpE [Lentisphaerota bacterium]